MFGGYYIQGWQAEDSSIYSAATMYATHSVTYTASVENGMLVPTTDTVRCVFVNNDGEQISDTGVLASGANACMALSGMSKEQLKAYREGLDTWLKDNSNKQLKTSEIKDGYFEYSLGAAKQTQTPTTETDDKSNGMNEYFIMFIILAAGVIALGASLGVYLVMRKRSSVVNFKNFKEEARH